MQCIMGRNVKKQSEAINSHYVYYPFWSTNVIHPNNPLNPSDCINSPEQEVPWENVPGETSTNPLQVVYPCEICVVKGNREGSIDTNKPIIPIPRYQFAGGFGKVNIPK